MLAVHHSLVENWNVMVDFHSIYRISEAFGCILFTIFLRCISWFPLREKNKWKGRENWLEIREKFYIFWVKTFNTLLHSFFLGFTSILFHCFTVSRESIHLQLKLLHFFFEYFIAVVILVMGQSNNANTIRVHLDAISVGWYLKIHRAKRRRRKRRHIGRKNK